MQAHFNQYRLSRWLLTHCWRDFAASENIELAYTFVLQRATSVSPWCARHKEKWPRRVQLPRTCQLPWRRQVWRHRLRRHRRVVWYSTAWRRMQCRMMPRCAMSGVKEPSALRSANVALTEPNRSPSELHGEWKHVCRLFLSYSC